MGGTYGSGTYGATYATYGGGSTTGVSASGAYAYGSDAIKPTEWYTEKFQGYAETDAGAAEAGFLATSGHDQSGLNVTDIIAIKNRLVVFYRESSQLWQSGPLPTDNALLDTYPFGCLGGATLFHNRPLFLAQRGFRLFELGGLQYDSLEDTGIGEPIQSLGDQITVHAASFWPWTGCYVAAVTIENPAGFATGTALPTDSPLNTASLTCLLIHSNSREGKVAAWSYAIIAGIGTVTRIWANGHRLYLHAGSSVWFLDAKDKTTVADAGQETAFPFAARQAFVDYGNALVGKRFLELALIQNGACNAGFAFTPHFTGEAIDGLPIEGITTSRAKLPLGITGYTLSLEFSGSGTRRTPWTLEQAQISGIVHQR